MWLKNKITTSYGHLFVALLLLHHNAMNANAANMAQMKNTPQQQQQLQTTLAQQTTALSSSSSSTQHHQQPQLQQVHAQMQHLLHSQQHQQQHQSLPSGLTAHPNANAINNGGNSVLPNSNGGHLNSESQNIPSTSSSTSSLAHLPPAQYVVNDKEAAMQEVLKHYQSEEDLNEPYQSLLNEYEKRELGQANAYQQGPVSSFHSSSPTSSPAAVNNMAYPWNLYNLPPPPMAGLFSQMFNPFDAFTPAPFPVTPRFMPIMSYPQPVYVPYPFIMPPEMFYPSYSPLPSMPSDYEDSMSRGAGTRRPSSNQQHSSSSYSRNSPIYYVRLPPTPYMFLPNLALGNTPSPMSGYPSMLPYQSLPSFPPFSSIFNLPINFLANGKPSNIYQMGAPPNDIQSSPLQFANVPSSFNTRPPPPPPLNGYRPNPAQNYFNPPHSSAPSTASSNYNLYPNPSPSSSSLQDSKLTALKRPYYFNGRPEDIYVLPNNLNAMYSSENSYY